MLLQIVQGTPAGVWVLLAGLVALGLQQARERTIGSLRAAVLPAAFVVLSLAGVVSAFGGNALALAAWAAGVGAAIGAGPRLLPRLRATWQAAGDTLRVAGSWLPLALIVSLFLVKYAAGVSLALHPGLAADRSFVVACGLAYGAFSGLFAARGLQLLQVRRAARAGGAPARALA
jgi:amino acid permease